MCMGVFEYGKKCIFLSDNMSKGCQDVPDDVEVKVIFVRENFHTGTFLFEKGRNGNMSLLDLVKPCANC